MPHKSAAPVNVNSTFARMNRKAFLIGSLCGDSISEDRTQAGYDDILPTAPGSVNDRVAQLPGRTCEGLKLTERHAVFQIAVRFIMIEKNGWFRLMGEYRFGSSACGRNVQHDQRHAKTPTSGGEPS